MANRITRAKRTVLVVEDNEMNRAMLCALLEDDFNVIQAENGLMGLQQLEERHEDLSLILLDVYMPECDGFEFLRRKRDDSRFNSIPVIVTTASDEPDDEIECLKLGATDFVVKPYNAEIIKNRMNNIISLRESAAIVNHLTRDALTGLYSRHFFYRNVEGALAESPVRFDMVCSDIVNFKSFNERYGEQRCNQMLRTLASTLTDILPGLVAGGRIGGDVFAFLIEHQEGDWTDVISRALDDTPDFMLNVKFGVVRVVDPALAVSLTCDRALIALDSIKRIHDKRFAFYDDELRQRQLTEQAVAEGMERALEERQFAVYYQPKHDLRTNRTGGAEALARWFHPELGIVSPELFIPIFERNGFVTKLDLYIFEEACREQRRCQELGLAVVPISVNISKLDFDHPALADRLTAIADEHGVDHALLHIEVTETAYSDDPTAVVATLKSLRERGFATELDDFGSGYSALASLNTLPLDVMKLDMSLIREATRLNDFRIVEASLHLASLLGLTTVAEGVESAEEVDRLRGMGCDLIQGYYYSRPLPADKFEEYLRR